MSIARGVFLLPFACLAAGQGPFLTAAKLARKARITKLFRWDFHASAIAKE
ncbi:hypothetical protein HMPREF6485_1242 [Segatella buccae ATCC 33574]|uniref:Uncharacterized protein n=1 Tax=Segatella buccae ATCC 33574 TaxID=873513 RepID=E6K6J3_9BACT|nr:hypothetical protein HMPREF6485_1242 [Segatella buccae ATCC 33574]